MSHLVRDVRHGIRLLRRSPGFTSVAVVVLALAIGANTAMFSIVNALVLQPRPGRIDGLVGGFSRDRVKVDHYRDFCADFIVVGSQYFQTLGLRVLRGREFSLADDEPGSGSKLALVDLPLARSLIGDDDALGRQILIQPRDGAFRAVHNRRRRAGSAAGSLLAGGASAGLCIVRIEVLREHDAPRPHRSRGGRASSGSAWALGATAGDVQRLVLRD
jgi:hypothetical protein